MKIENKLTTPLPGDLSTDNRPAKSGGPAAANPAPGGSVDVHLSSLATQLQSLQDRLASGEVADSAKVAEIRQAISEGRFHINPDVIADRLLDTVRELLKDYPRS